MKRRASVKKEDIRGRSRGDILEVETRDLN